MSNDYTNNNFERGSRISHSYIINDEDVKQYLNNCEIPVEAEDVELNDALKHDIIYPETNTIEFIVAVDGESTTIPVKKSFPSSLITFFQFGSLLIETIHLDEMEKKPFVSPSDIKQLKRIKREKFVLPTKNVALKKDFDFRTTVREAIHEFFKKTHSGKTSILETLYWFLFEQYNPSSTKSNYSILGDPTKLFNVEEAALYLKVSKSHIYKLTSAKLIQFSKPTGKAILFRKSDLDCFVNENKLKTSAQIENEAISVIARRKK